MSEENVERVRSGIERWADGGFGVDAISVDLYAPDVEWDLSAYPLVDFPNRGRGRESLFSNLTEFFAGWREYRSEVTECIDAGQDVIVVTHETARIGDSSVLAERDVSQVFTLRDGQVVKWRVFETKAEALEAAGLEE